MIEKELEKMEQKIDRMDASADCKKVLKNFNDILSDCLEKIVHKLIQNDSHIQGRLNDHIDNCSGRNDEHLKSTIQKEVELYVEKIEKNIKRAVGLVGLLFVLFGVFWVIKSQETNKINYKMLNKISNYMEVKNGF